MEAQRESMGTESQHESLTAKFESLTELSEEDWEDFRSALKDQYQLYIQNPSSHQGVSFSLWYQTPDYEYPVLNSNSGNFPVFSSRHKTFGDGIEPTDEFFSLIGIGFHESMSFMPHIYLEGEHFNRTVQNVYGNKTRQHEIWIAHTLINWLASAQEPIPELRPIAQWANRHTEFGVPCLSQNQTKSTEE